MEMLNIFSLEGIDGSGKSTQMNLIKKSLEKKGFKIQLLKSPSNTPLGEFLRDNVLSLNSWIKQQLFVIDITASLKGVNKRKNILLWDRYIDSFYTSNQEMNLKESEELTKSLPKPIKTFFFDIPINDVLKRKIHTHSINSWLKIKQKRYYEVFKNEPNRIVLINANQPINKITEKIVKEIVKSCER